MTRTDGDLSHSRLRQIEACDPHRADIGAETVQRVALKPRETGKVFAGVIACIVIVGAFANFAVYNLAPHPDHPIADVLKRFDLGHEPSIPAFYSATVMLASAAFLLFLGRFDHSGGKARRRSWYALSFLFVLLAIDETVMFHEMASAAMQRLNLSGPFYFSWIIPGLAFAAIVGFAFLRFLLLLNPRTRSLLILSGVVFLAGAIGMEFIAGLIFAAAESEEAAIRSISHVVVQAIEEGLEMTGVAIFLCALIDYANIVGLEVNIRNDSSKQVSTSE